MILEVLDDVPVELHANIAKYYNTLVKQQFFKNLHSKTDCIDRRGQQMIKELSFEFVGRPFCDKCRQRIKPSPHVCIFCTQKYEGFNSENVRFVVDTLHVLQWRNYFIEANKFPYMPEQIVIYSRNHVGQAHISQPSVQSDIFDYFASSVDPISVCFNHTAGASIIHHFHFHSTPLIFPIANYLDKLTDYVQVIGGLSGRVFHGKGKCYTGIHFRANVNDALNLKQVYLKIVGKVLSLNYHIGLLLYSTSETSNFVLFLQHGSNLPYGASDLAGYMHSCCKDKECLQEAEKVIIQSCTMSVIQVPELNIVFEEFKDKHTSFPTSFSKELYRSSALVLYEEKDVFVLRDAETNEWYSQINTKTKQVYGRYLRVIMHVLSNVMKNNNINVLELGLGGGSIAYHMANHFKKATLIAVDYSKEMIDVARRFFYDDTTQNSLIHYVYDDAKRYVKTDESMYDVVINDLFVNDNIKPKWSASNDFIMNIVRLLQPTGIYVSNQIVNISELHTLRKYFTNVKCIQLSAIVTHRIVFAWNGDNRRYDEFVTEADKFHVQTFGTSAPLDTPAVGGKTRKTVLNKRLPIHKSAKGVQSR